MNCIALNFLKELNITTDVVLASKYSKVVCSRSLCDIDFYARARFDTPKLHDFQIFNGFRDSYTLELLNSDGIGISVT